MGIYRSLKKSFAFLTKQYGFRIDGFNRSGYGPYISWNNDRIRIVIHYIRDRVELRVYDESERGPGYWDPVIYMNEFASDSRNEKEKVNQAARWLQEKIEKKEFSLIEGHKIKQK